MNIAAFSQPHLDGWTAAAFAAVQPWEERCSWCSVTCFLTWPGPEKETLRSIDTAPVCLWQAALPAHGLCSGTDGQCAGEKGGHTSWSLWVLGRSLVSSCLLGPGRCAGVGPCVSRILPSCPFQNVVTVWGKGSSELSAQL